MIAEKCKRGHAFTPENTYNKPNGSRQCRKCQRERKRTSERRRRVGHELETLNFVPNAALRERFLVLERTLQTTAAEVALALGWRVGSGYGDGQRLLVALGLQAVKGAIRHQIRYETGVKLARVLGLDPHEADV